ncbi:MAG TPA: hypothetical protein VHB21_27085 [Minicystis sp.]|nr:hypothetical protein [Minicystis sp.]
MMDDFVQRMQSQLDAWERRVEEMAKGDRKQELERFFEQWRGLRESGVRTLEELRASSGDRIDVLKMGVESAWAELKAAFDAATTVEPSGEKNDKTKAA